MPDTLIGLDLGKAGDYSALSVVRRHLVRGPDDAPLRGARGETLYGYVCRRLHRWKLGTMYPEIVRDVAHLVKGGGMPAKPRLVIDGTGVGSAVVDMFIAARVQAQIHPIIITGGSTWRTDRWPGGPGVRAFWVAKTELVSSMQAAFQSRRFVVVPPAMPHANVLKEELKNFRVHVTKSAHETYEAREGAHDDLVLSVAMTVWAGGCRYVHFRNESLRPAGQEGPLAAEEAALVAEQERDASLQQRESDERRKKAEADYANPMADHWWW